MKFWIAYNSESLPNARTRRYHFVSETIEARGIMHAAKLASDHAKELSKTLGESVNVAKITQLKPEIEIE